MKVKYWGQEAKNKADYNKDCANLSRFNTLLYKGYTNDFIHDEYQIWSKKRELDNVNYHDTLGQMKRKDTRLYIDAVQAIADYLKAVKEHVTKHIINTENKKNTAFGNLFSKKRHNFQFVLTVPSLKGDFAREIMTEAAIRADIIKSDETNNLLTLTEPKAAAITCLNTYKQLILDFKNPTADLNLIVCNIAEYAVELEVINLGLDIDTKKSIIRQIGNTVGDSIGSNYIDEKFDVYLAQFYEDMDIEYSIKNSYNGTIKGEFIKAVVR